MKKYILKNGKVYVYINNIFSHFIVDGKAIANTFSVPEQYL